MINDALIGFLAECGLIFIEGAPPKTEDGTLLVWNGGCNALVAQRDNGDLVTWEDSMSLVESDIVCWMRLPHPSIWPMTKPSAALIPEHDLYSANTDVLTTFQKRLPMTDALNQTIERAIWKSLHTQHFDVVGKFSVTDLVTDIIAAMEDASTRKDEARQNSDINLGGQPSSTNETLNQKALDKTFLEIMNHWREPLASRDIEKVISIYNKHACSEITVNDEEQLVADIAADICDTISRLNGIPYTPAQWMGTARNALKHFAYHSSSAREFVADKPKCPQCGSSNLMHGHSYLHGPFYHCYCGADNIRFNSIEAEALKRGFSIEREDIEALIVAYDHAVEHKLGISTVSPNVNALREMLTHIEGQKP